MKREATLSKDTIARVKAIRDGYGDREYSREDILSAVVEVIRSNPLDVDQMYVARAHSLLDNFDSSDDRHSENQGEMFPSDAHVALGDNKRIRRERMTADHVMRRKSLIDKQFTAHQDAWKDETAHLNGILPELVANPGMTIGDIRSATRKQAAE